MLPPELADDACSLRPHVDRLCVTVELSFDGREPTFYRSVIRSDARLTYEQAQRMLAGNEPAEPALLEALNRAEEVTARLREPGLARGSRRGERADGAVGLDRR